MTVENVIEQLEMFQNELSQVEDAARETAEAADDLSIELEDIVFQLQDIDDPERAQALLKDYLDRVEELGAHIMGYDAAEKFERLARGR